MQAESDDRADREHVELDAHDWSLPNPTVTPVGPASEVWPARVRAGAEDDEESPEGPAAA
ncbi:MAG: hypothetical protein ACRDNY_11365 [Gaiellaceae bacterium]